VKRFLTLLVLVAAATVGVWAVREREARWPVPLPCSASRVGSIQAEVTAPGRVESLRDLTVRAAGEGRIQAVLVKEGDLVRAEQELVRYDTADARNRLDQAKDRVAKAELEIKDVERELKTTRSLIPFAGESKQRLEALEIRCDLARLSRSLFEKELGLALSQLDKMLCHAAEDGTVVEKIVEEGEWTVPGKPLFRIARTDRLKVTTFVDEVDAPRIRVGNRAEVTADSLPGRTFPGKVVQIHPSARIERESTVVKVVVELEGEVVPDEGLRIGNQVDVRVIHASADGCVLVPVEAVEEVRGGGSFVWVLAGGVVRRRPVTMGLQNSRDAEIREGLTKGDTVVLLLGQPVSEGMLGEVAPDGDAAGKGEAAGSAGQ